MSTDLPAAFLGPSGREPRSVWRTLEHARGGFRYGRHYRADELWYWHLTDEEIAAKAVGEELA